MTTVALASVVPSIVGVESLVILSTLEDPVSEESIISASKESTKVSRASLTTSEDATAGCSSSTVSCIPAFLLFKPSKELSLFPTLALAFCSVLLSIEVTNSDSSDSSILLDSSISCSSEIALSILVIVASSKIVSSTAPSSSLTTLSFSSSSISSLSSVGAT